MKTMTILVVDDDRQIRDALAKVLRAEGYGVALASDTEQARILYDPERIHLLLLDLNLPQTNGWDLFEWFTFTNPLLPIIIITGRTNQYQLAAASGVSALMEKPLNVPLLLQTIADLLAEPSENRLKRLTGRKGLLRYSGARGATLPRSAPGDAMTEQLRGKTSDMRPNQ